jgi:hypothetical protein
MANTKLSFGEYLYGKYGIELQDYTKEDLALYVDEYIEFC